MENLLPIREGNVDYKTKLFGPYKHTIFSSETYTLSSSSQLNLRFVYFLNGNLRGTMPAR